METVWIECCNADVYLHELQTHARVFVARDMLRKYRSRANDIRSGASSKCNPGEVYNLQTRVTPSLAKAIQDVAPSVGRLRIARSNADSTIIAKPFIS